jgi:hypothetical protein
MTSNIKVSILIPCFNVEKYLRQCLDSVINQTIKEIEIICINDGSTDGTLSILEYYAKNDNRIRIIDKENSGYGDSMNQALSAATGNYIGIVESDDFVELCMFESLYSIAIKNNLDISRCCYFEYKSGINTPVLNNWVPKNQVHNPNEIHAAFWQAPSIWCSIYRRSWLNENKIRFLPTPGASYQDTSFAFKCYACCQRLYISDIPLLHYRTDNESSSVNNPEKVFCVCDEWKEIYRFVRSNRRRFSHLLPLIPILQYGTYRWNYERLNGKFKSAFLKAWAKELFIHLVKGELPLHKLDSDTKAKIKHILISPFKHDVSGESK